jgi:hypothetical protein
MRHPGAVSLVAYTARREERQRLGMCCTDRYGSTPEPDGYRSRRHDARKATLTGAIAPTRPLTALDACDRCGAQAYVRVLLTNGGELLFCAHHGRVHAEALAKVAVDIQDESNRLSEPQPE